MSAQQISWMVTHFSCLASFSLPWTTILHLTLNGTRHVPERTWQLLPLSPLRGTPMCHFAFHVILTQPPTSFSVKIMIVVHLKHFMLVASSLTITNNFFLFQYEATSLLSRSTDETSLYDERSSRHWFNQLSYPISTTTSTTSPATTTGTDERQEEKRAQSGRRVRLPNCYRP